MPVAASACRRRRGRMGQTFPYRGIRVREGVFLSSPPLFFVLAAFCGGRSRPRATPLKRKVCPICPRWRNCSLSRFTGRAPTRSLRSARRRHPPSASGRSRDSRAHAGSCRAGSLAPPSSGQKALRVPVASLLRSAQTFHEPHSRSPMPHWSLPTTQHSSTQRPKLSSSIRYASVAARTAFGGASPPAR